MGGWRGGIPRLFLCAVTSVPSENEKPLRQPEASICHMGKKKNQATVLCFGLVTTLAFEQRLSLSVSPSSLLEALGGGLIQPGSYLQCCRALTAVPVIARPWPAGRDSDRCSHSSKFKPLWHKTGIVCYSNASRSGEPCFDSKNNQTLQ